VQRLSGKGQKFERVKTFIITEQVMRICNSETSQSSLFMATANPSIFKLRHNYFTPIHNILSTAPQLSISKKTLGTLHEDGNVIPKHVGATVHN
jgi:hypothetical protein